MNCRMLAMFLLIQEFTKPRAAPPPAPASPPPSPRPAFLPLALTPAMAPSNTRMAAAAVASVIADQQQTEFEDAIGGDVRKILTEAIKLKGAPPQETIDKIAPLVGSILKRLPAPPASQAEGPARG